MIKLPRRFSLTLSIPLLVSFVLPPLPAFALRILQDQEGRQKVLAGMEQTAEDWAARARAITAPGFQEDRVASLAGLWQEFHGAPIEGKRHELHELIDQAIAFEIPDSLAGSVAVEVRRLDSALLADLLAHLAALPQSPHPSERLDLLLAKQLAKLPDESLSKIFLSQEPFTFLIPGAWVSQWGVSYPREAIPTLMIQAGYGQEFAMVFKRVPIPPSAGTWSPARVSRVDEVTLSFVPRRFRPASSAAAVQQIGSQRVAEAAETLIDIAAHDPDLQVRQEAARALLRMKSSSLYPMIRALDRSEDDRVRWIAVHLLDRLGRDAVGALPKLRQLSRNEEEPRDIRIAAFSAVKSIEESAWPEKKNGNGKLTILEIPENLSPVLWAGDLEPLIQVIGGRPIPPEVNLDVWAPGATEDEILDSLHAFTLILKGNGDLESFPIDRSQIRFDRRGFGLNGENRRLWAQLPQGAQEMLARQGRLSFSFRYQIPDEEKPRQTSQFQKRGTGELSYHPDWLFRNGMTTINAKAWGSFEAILRRLPELEAAGVKVILLHGIHPGHSAFEIDNYEIADPKLGGDEALDRLLQEGKQRGFRFIIPFVPGHASDQNHWIKEDPRLFYQVKEQGEFLETKTILVDFDDRPVRFLRGNVFPEGNVHSAEIKEGFGPTVAFNLWSPIARKILAPRWEEILGKWAQRGVSGFYTDTAHSIEKVLASVGDPDWLDGIKRHVRAKNPGVIFGDEALWGKDGPFINERGASFAQPYWPYIELLLDFVKGWKQPVDLAKKLAVAEEKAPGMLRQVAIFLQNHDENVKPVAFYVDRDPKGRKEEFLGVLAALQILGLPGIPSLEIGQISGDPEKWLVTGHTKKYDKQWNYGYDPNAPPPDLYDPFTDQSERAQRLRGLYSQLFRLRSDNPAFWLSEQIRYSTASAHLFASYRSAGNHRAVVVSSVNRSAPDPRVDAVVELDKLDLPAEEMAALAGALERPSFVWPAPVDAEPLQGKVEQNLLMLKMPPTGVVVLEFEVPDAAAGVEQPDFPAPARTGRQVAWTTWRDGGNVYPSSSGPLGTVAFVSPGDGKAGVGIYASLWNLNGMVPEVFHLPGIPPDHPVHLYDSMSVPRETRDAAERILREKILPKRGSGENGWEEKGLEVVARLSGTRGGQDWIVPMVPIDAGAGQIRFEGWVPARAEFIGDYTVTVEVRWGEAWHRLKEPGRFRIHPLDSNGSKLRIPEGVQKYKLWVSPTGQPVVIGWDPSWSFKKAPPSWQMPVADRPYWIRSWDGRSYLLDHDRMKRFGFSYDPDRPDIWPEQPIVEAAIHVDLSGGAVIIPSGEVFDDKKRTLGARLEKAFEILKIRWPLDGFQPLPQPPEYGRHASLEPIFERLQGVGDPISFRDLLAQWEEGGWERMGNLLRKVSPEERDRFLRLTHRSFARWARRNPRAPVFRAFSDPQLRSFQPDGLPIVALSLNGVWDLIWRSRADLPGRPIEQTLLPGGGPLAAARSAANLREGGEVDVVSVGFGEDGERLFAGLRQSGFLEEPRSGKTAKLIPVQGQETRVSVNGVVSSSPAVPANYVRDAAEAVVRKMAGYGQRKGILVIGEHLVRVSDSDDPYWVAKELVALVKTAKEMGWKIAVAASSSWDTKTFNEILAVRPDIFHLDLEPFTRLVSSKQKKYTEEELLYLPKEELAELADRIRGLYGVERLIVSLGAAGEILVTPSASFAAFPSPDLELTYVTGERDVVLGVFTRLLQMGAPEKEALHQAAVAGVLHMEGWARPVTQQEIAANLHRAQVYELLRPAQNRVAPRGVIEPPSFPEAVAAPFKTERFQRDFRTFSVAENPAARFARAARRDSPVRVVIGPSAFQVEGMATVLEMLAGTSLRDRLEVLPSEQVSYPQRISEMTALVRRLWVVRDVFVVGHAADTDPIMDEFEERLFSFPFERRGLEALQEMVRQLLLDLGVPEGTATEKAVVEFLSAAGLEMNV